MILAVAAAAVIAQVSPAPSPPAASPSPQASSTPSAIGPALGPNDPCTTISAIVNRPTVTNAVCTVRPGHVEIEGGYQNTTFSGSGNTVAYPQTLIRFGLPVPALELLILPPQYNRMSAGGIVTTGSTDIGAGLKYVLGYSPKFNYGVQASFTGATGTPGISAGATQSLYALQMGYTLSPVFSLTAGLQDQILATGGTNYGSFVPSLVLGATLPANTSLFAEIAQFTHALGPGSATRTQYLFGASHSFGQRLQVDVEAAFSPTAATTKYGYVGFGFGYYF